MTNERPEKKYAGNVNFTLSEEYAAKLDRIAEREKRGQSAQAHWFIEEAIDAYEQIDAKDAAALLESQLWAMAAVSREAPNIAGPAVSEYEITDELGEALPV